MKFDVVHIAQTDSTNRWLRQHEGQGNTVVVADYQTAGRGCGTNSWESEAGKNLLFSVRLHPDWVGAAAQFQVSMAVANAIRRALQAYLVPPVEVKWPNDIYVGDGKICGMLIENRLQGGCIKDCIVGIGLNVNQTRFVSDAPNPVSMLQVDGRCAFSRDQVLNRVLTELAFTLDLWDAPAIAAEYRAHLYRREGYHPFSDAAGPFEARMETVEPDGHLLLVDSSGQPRRYAFKEVQFLVTKTAVIT